MAVFTTELRFSTKCELDLVDITDRLREAVSDSGVKNGILTVFVPGATGAVTALEFEPGLIKDLPSVLEELVPKMRSYWHHDDNGHSHVRAALLGPSESIPIVNSRLTLGTWQQIIFVELDTRPRSRRLVVQILGE